MKNFLGVIDIKSGSLYENFLYPFYYPFIKVIASNSFLEIRIHDIEPQTCQSGQRI